MLKVIRVNQGLNSKIDTREQSINLLFSFGLTYCFCLIVMQLSGNFEQVISQ